MPPVSVLVRAPATSANLGPGFDCLGLTLDLWNEVAAAPLLSPDASPDDGENLIARAARALFAHVGAPYPGLRLTCTNRVPFSRGLGSSAAAIASGLLIGNRLLCDPLSQAELLDLAAALEGHPDNVVPCLLGGVRAAVLDGAGHVRQAAVPLAVALVAAVFVPEAHVPTKLARAALPGSVPLADALFNVSRTALLVAALASGKVDLLRGATEDRLHQQYRAPLFPAAPGLIAAALAGGALGAYSSGAGPSVLALCADADAAARVCQALERCASEASTPGSALTIALSATGAHVVDGA